MFVAGVGLAAALLRRLPGWNWHGYSTSYTLVSAADHIVGGVIAGAVLAAIV
jgi:hypothetical protein